MYAHSKIPSLADVASVIHLHSISEQMRLEYIHIGYVCTLDAAVMSHCSKHLQLSVNHFKCVYFIYVAM